MFGGGIVWFYRKLAGINTDPDQPGYKHIVFKPQPADEISFTSYSNLTPYGTASVSWKKDSGRFLLDIKVPVGSTATVFVPMKNEIKDLRKINKVKGADFQRIEEGYAVYKTGSGSFRFESAY
jgi:alpha-L-rhamnosidase